MYERLPYEVFVSGPSRGPDKPYASAESTAPGRLAPVARTHNSVPTAASAFCAARVAAVA